MNFFVREEMDVKDQNESIDYVALMVRLRNTIVLKYMVLIKDNIYYPKLITEIRCHI